MNLKKLVSLNRLLLLFSCVGWVLFLLKPPKTVTLKGEDRVVFKTKYVDREVIKYKDRVVNKTRTIIKTDGTKIVEKTQTETSESKFRDEKVSKKLNKKVTKKEVVNSPQKLYSLGMSFKDFKTPGFQGSVRLGRTPLNLTGQIFSDTTVTLGLRIDF